MQRRFGSSGSRARRVLMGRVSSGRQRHRLSPSFRKHGQRYRIVKITPERLHSLLHT
jgi:hypothetical protein